MEIKHLLIERELSDDENLQRFLVKNTNSGRFIRLGARETNYLLQTLNASEEASALQLEEVEDLPENLKGQLFTKFEEWDFLNDNSQELKRKDKFSDPSKIKLIRFNVEKLINFIYPFYSKLFSRGGLLLLALLFLADVSIIGYFLLSAAEATTSNISFKFDMKDIILTVILYLLSTAAHEMGHAVVCKKYGGKVKSMGILLFYFFPCFYCDVTDIYGIQKRKHRARVALAGVFTNMILGLFTLLVAFLLMFYNIIPLPLYYFSISCLWVSFYNLIPFVKLDGYWLLSATLGVTNLMDKGFLAAYTTIFDRKNIVQMHMTAVKRRLVALYGVIAFLFKPLFWSYNLFLLSNYFEFRSEVVFIVMILGVCLILLDLSKNIRRYYKMVKYDYYRLLNMMS